VAGITCLAQNPIGANSSTGHARRHRPPKTAFRRFRQAVQAVRVAGVQIVLEDQQDGRRHQHGGKQDRKSRFHFIQFFELRGTDLPGHIVVKMTAS
jgi:hypothetical protein